MSKYMRRNIGFHLSLLVCLLLVTARSLPASAGIKMRVGHSTSWIEEEASAPSLLATQPTSIDIFHFTAIATGSDHTCGLTTGNGVKCWGNNIHGQLGNGTMLDSSTPVDVVGLDNGVMAIAAGWYHTCAILSGGGVKCWGNNSAGQLGDGTNLNSNTPIDVVGLGGGVTAIAAGKYHTCGLTLANGIKCWGDNGSGQLGDGTWWDSSQPVDVFGLGSGIKSLAAGLDHNCALTSVGTVKCWGWNGSGQLGNGTMSLSNTPVDVVNLDEKVTKITAGTHHTCALTESRGVKCWGWNYYGQLGDGNLTWGSSIPVDVIDLSEGVIAVTAGYGHTCVLTWSGRTECWGWNYYGQLGDGTSMDHPIPLNVVGISGEMAAVAAGDSHTCAMTSLGKIKCWGNNGSGQLGVPIIAQRSIPADVEDQQSGMAAITSGSEHTCGLALDGGVKCWGSNGYGQLGDGTTTDHNLPVQVLGLEDIVAVDGGGFKNCALTSGGGVKCWGDAFLGDGTDTASSTPVGVVGLDYGVISVSASIDHTCALISGGEVKCWGVNNFGQLGDGTTTWSSTPVDVVGLDSEVVAVTAGTWYTCALTSGGGVKCWGDNGLGQLGDGTEAGSSTPVDVVGLGSGVTRVEAGEYFTCALTSSGGVKCWGDNEYGQLGDGTTTNRSTPVDVIGLDTGVISLAETGTDHTCALTLGGGVKCWGWNGYGELGNGTGSSSNTPVDVVGLSSGMASITAGGGHTCALTDNGRAKCWGEDNYGQLGIGTVILYWSPTPVEVLDSASYLTVNYPNGQPGSYFTVTGWNFPSEAYATISVNGQVITNTLAVNPTGSFIFFLDTAGAEIGNYFVTASVGINVSASFNLSDYAPLRIQEGGGQTFTVPAGLAVHNVIYLPFVKR